MEKGLRRCTRCQASTLALRRRRISMTGLTKHYQCRACGAHARVGTWGNVAINLAIALVVIPTLLYVQGRGLDSIPRGAILAGAVLVGLSAFEIWRMRQFSARHPVD